MANARKATKMLHSVQWNKTILKENKMYAGEKWTNASKIKKEAKEYGDEFSEENSKKGKMDKMRNERTREVIKVKEDNTRNLVKKKN